MELVGQEEVEGTAAYKLKITRNNGYVIYIYLDSKHFLPLKGMSKAVPDDLGQAAAVYSVELEGFLLELGQQGHRFLLPASYNTGRSATNLGWGSERHRLAAAPDLG